MSRAVEVILAPCRPGAKYGFQFDGRVARLRHDLVERRARGGLHVGLELRPGREPLEAVDRQIVGVEDGHVCAQLPRQPERKFECALRRLPEVVAHENALDVGSVHR